MSLSQTELELAERIGRKVAFRWSAVDADDVVSHLYLWLLENLSVVERYRAEIGGEGKLFVSLRREAGKFAAKEQAAAKGNPLVADSFYTSDRVAAVLPFIFGEWPQQSVHVNPVTGEPIGEVSNGDVLAIMADVSGAFYGLNRDAKEVLCWRFRDDLTFDEIGALAGISKVAAKKRVDRALSRLCDSLS